MPPQPIQLITPQENRTLDSSLGDWLGDAIWDYGPFGPFYGVALFIMDPPNVPKSIALSYPNVSPFPGQINTLSFFIIAAGASDVRMCDWTLTDGVTSFQGSAFIEIYETYHLITEDLNIPSSWWVGASTLTVSFRGEPWPYNVLACDRFSLIYQKSTKPQYLPLLGIG